MQLSRCKLKSSVIPLHIQINHTNFLSNNLFEIVQILSLWAFTGNFTPARHERSHVERLQTCGKRARNCIQRLALVGYNFSQITNFVAHPQLLFCSNIFDFPFLTTYFKKARLRKPLDITKRKIFGDKPQH